MEHLWVPFGCDKTLRFVVELVCLYPVPTLAWFAVDGQLLPAEFTHCGGGVFPLTAQGCGVIPAWDSHLNSTAVVPKPSNKRPAPIPGHHLGRAVIVVAKQ